MTQTVNVVAGIIHDILVAPEDGTFAEVYPADFLDRCIQAPDDVRVGWTFDGKAFAAPVAPEPSPPGPRLATSYRLVSVLTDDEVAGLGKAKAKDQHLFGKRTDPFPEDNPKIARFAAALGTTPKAWFDRVFGVVPS